MQGVVVRLGGGLAALGAVPLALFALIPAPIVTLSYGARYEAAAPLLFALGLAAFVQYACYLAVQVLISRGRTWSVVVFAVMGIAEATLITAYHDSLSMVAMILVGMRLATLFLILIGAWADARSSAVARTV